MFCLFGELFTGTSLSFVHPRRSEHAASQERLNKLEKHHKCRCSRGTCYSKIDHIKNSLLRFLQLFWHMSKNLQDLFARCQVVVVVVSHCCFRSLLHSHANTTPANKSCFLRSRRQWARSCLERREGSGTFWANACLRSA